MRNHESRRNFLYMLGTSLVAILTGGFTKKLASSDVRSNGVFGNQFLKKGHVIEVPEGYYDPEQRLFIRKDTGEPLVVAEQMTGVWTYSDTTRCTNMWYPKDGPPQCVQTDTDQDQHPDGFKPGE
jgi:hypothetical protein